MHNRHHIYYIYYVVGFLKAYPASVIMAFHQDASTPFTIRYEAIHNFKYQNKYIYNIKQMKIKKSIADLATPLHTILTMVLAVLAISSFRADKTKTIFMIGDSTMANKDISGDKQERGWGMMLQNYFDDGIIVDNHAMNGRSSKSFINEGRWKAVLDRIMPGDYLIIQFGHNDEKTDSARHTTPGTTFDANLRRFVREAREKGATPILMNSVVRRNFSDSKTAVADDDLRDNSSKQLAEGDTLIDTHGEYLVSPRRVAKEMGVVFVDANKITHDLEQSMGKEGSKKLHMIFKPGETQSLPDGRQDNTHYNIFGANKVAGLLADALCRQVAELAKHHVYYDIYVSKNGSGQFDDLESAVASAPKGRKVTIAVSGGEWKKPEAMKGKKVKFVLTRGAKFL